MVTATRNCKYVAMLSDGSYIYKIEGDKILVCYSRLRARQFTKTEAEKLKRAIKVKLHKATWEHVDLTTK